MEIYKRVKKRVIRKGYYAEMIKILIISFKCINLVVLLSINLCYNESKLKKNKLIRLNSI